MSDRTTPIYGYTSLLLFQRAHPTKDSVMRVIATNNNEVQIRYFIGNEDIGKVAHFLTSFVFINGYTATIEQVAIVSFENQDQE